MKEKTKSRLYYDSITERNKQIFMTYNKTYSETKHVFGIEPEKILINFVDEIDKTRPILDIGVGQGRNSIFLAKKEFSIDAIDPSQISIETIINLSEKENYNIRAYQNNFDQFVTKYPSYSAILIFGLIQILDWKSIYSLTNKIDKFVTKGSLVFITAFSIKDASYFKYSKEWNKVGKNSYSDNNGNFRTFLEPNEILDLFKNYSVLYHWEGLGPKHKHGNNPVEQHELIELVIKKE
jgi:2-polyprenyl-3-methyl-5-hydroxy-6-metoxy-1,4-benzoquinol methylase